MKICGNCGRQLDDQFQFCSVCGGRADGAQKAAKPRSKEPWKLLLVLSVSMLIIGALIGGVGRPAAVTTTTAYSTVSQPEYSTFTETQTVQAGTQSPSQSGWQTIATFTGSASKDTPDFNVPTNYWRVIYTIQAQTGSEQYASFTIFIYPSGETVNFVASAELFKSGTETSYVRAGPGVFWIHVIAANLASWTIEVQTQT